MDPIPTLDLALSEARAYVFAGDLFDALVGASGAAPPARMRLRRVGGEVMELRQDAPRPSDPDYCGLFSHGEGDAARVLWLRRRPGEVIARRLAVRDKDVLADLELGHDSATARLLDGFSVAKSALILAVALIDEAFPHDTWDLSELRADGPFHRTGRVRVDLDRRLGRFLVILVHVDDVYWGQFTLASTPLAEPPA